MDKRYQVFVSSTYADLQDERRSVMQTIMELDCFPAGMELFPAFDEDQWEFIKRVIGDCDYYLLMIGGRYGSLTSEGVSYTEKEYEYAVERGLRVVAFLHENPDEISAGKSELDPEARAKLLAFRQKVAQGRLVKFYQRADELPGLVALSLSKTIKTYPAVGWTRATNQPSLETLEELNQLRKRLAQSESELAAARREAASTPLVTGLASPNTTVKLRGTYFSTVSPMITTDWSISLSWNELFATIAPALLDHPNDALARTRITDLLFVRTRKAGRSATLNAYDFDTMKIQFAAYQMITLDYTKTIQGGMALFWNLTAPGRRAMLEARVLKGDTAPTSDDASV